MPKVFTIAEIRDLDAETVVNSFRGKITKIFTPRKTGQGENGEWSFENFMIKDKAGDEIKVTLKDRPPLDKSLLNKEVTILAHHTDKGWSSVYAEDNEYNDKVSRVLRVTKKAEIVKGGSVAPKETEPGEGVEDDPGEPQEQDERPSPHKNPVARHENEETNGDLGPETDNPVAAAKEFLMKRANFEVLVHQAARHTGMMCEQVSHIPFTTEELIALKGRFYIDGSQQGLIDAMPTSPLVKPKPQETPDPEGEDPTQGEEEEPPRRKPANGKKR